jgi:hypothetical protein
LLLGDEDTDVKDPSQLVDQSKYELPLADTNDTNQNRDRQLWVQCRLFAKVHDDAYKQ